jgi:hypothetical protein
MTDGKDISTRNGLKANSAKADSKGDTAEPSRIEAKAPQKKGTARKPSLKRRLEEARALALAGKHGEAIPRLQELALLRHKCLGR